MEILKVGIIGYGGRIAAIVQLMRRFGIPFKVHAIADPKMDELKARKDADLAETRFYGNADDMLSHEKFSGIMIGTRCGLHAKMAIKASKANVPIFLEKPVAITFAQVKKLHDAFKNFKKPTVVSFPLRLSPLVLTVKEMINAGKIGELKCFNAFNDVPYGACYFTTWQRDYGEIGGLWLQKATHDLDYLTYIIGAKPRMIAAIKSQNVYGGKDKPFDLMCGQCGETEACIESPFAMFYKRRVAEKTEGNWPCPYSKDIKNEDFGSALVEFENGVQGSYTQCFFVKNSAGRRGARLYGAKGTIEFDWYTGEVNLMYHHKSAVETVKFEGVDGHGGGDLELLLDFLRAMRDGKKSRADIHDGILSALTCLWARESSENHKFCEIKFK